MPWITNTDGEKEYVVSAYVKEELPTWSEFYEEFYLNKVFEFNRDKWKHDEMDPYWKIPRKKVLLAQCCNQLNKMIHEDNLLVKIIDSLSKSNVVIKDCRFVIQTPTSGVDNNFIYSIPLPNGNKNPFVLTKKNRINIISYPDNLKLVLVVYDEFERKVFHSNTIMFGKIMDVLMEDLKEYFQGDIPGWKDIDTVKDNRMCRSGFDAAK